MATNLLLLRGNQVALPLDSAIFKFLISQKEKKQHIPNNVSHIGFKPTKLKFRVWMERVATPNGDLLGDPLGDPLDDLLTPCAGTLRTIAFTIYKIGD